MNRLSFLIYFLLGSLLTIKAQTLSVTDLRCEHMNNPSVVDELYPRLSWINNVSKSSIRGAGQSAYQICVASTKELLKSGKADVWNTEKVNSSESSLIIYNGKALESGKKYWWRVRVWDEKDKVSKWSEPSHWCMGFLKESDWKAKWIGYSWDDKTAPLIRKKIRMEKEIVEARVFVTGLGYFEFYVNGMKVSDDCLVPNFTNYTTRKQIETREKDITIRDNFRNYRVLYLSYDITDFLKKGDNAVGAILGNGFYKCSQMWVQEYGKPMLICQIEIRYKDNSTQTICSDESWKVHRSPIVMNDVYAGEVYDANKEIGSWCLPDYNDSNWENAQLRQAPVGKLTAQTSPSDKVTEVLSPVSLSKNEKGDWEVDFGKEISGWIHFKDISGNKGDTLKVKYICESKVGSQKYVFNDKITQSYAPRFTWFVFRKAIISGADKIEAKNIIAEAVNTDVNITSTFRTSNELINKINEIWQRSQLDNMHGCVASDCPHRERSPYTGDAQVTCETVMHNFDAAAFYQKWIRDINDAQDKTSGYVPNCAPWQPKSGGGVGWGAAINIMPWEYYIHYGDKRMLENNYEAMKAYIKYMLAWLTPDGTMLMQRSNLYSDTPNRWFNLGEWAHPFDLPSVEMVHTYFLWECADYTSKSAAVLGKKDDVKEYSELADNIRKAFNKKFYDKEAKTYGDYGSNIFALKVGVPEEYKQDVLNSWKDELCKKYNYHLNTGIFGTEYLFETLADNGMNDVAYKIINQTDFPSFGNWIRQGATTTWEQWNGKYSRNHPMFGGGIKWFYRRLAGVNADPKDPGYRHIIIKPIITDGLSEVEYSNMVPYGKVSSEVINNNGHIIMKLTIPVGSYATVYLPSANKDKIRESKKPLSQSKGVRINGNTDNETIVDIVQGTYLFEINK